MPKYRVTAEVYTMEVLEEVVEAEDEFDAEDQVYERLFLLYDQIDITEVEEE